MNYEDLLKISEAGQLDVREKDLRGSDGRIRGKRVAIRKTLATETEKACVLAEELGHYATTSGDILDQSLPENRQQELRARAWGYDLMIGLAGLISGYERGCRTRWELAEHLGVTEDYLQAAIDWYRAKYGISVDFEGYTVFFEPGLGILRKTNE